MHICNYVHDRRAIKCTKNKNSNIVHEYRFSGKKVIPFCTSGGGGLGDTAKNLKKLAPGAQVIDGKRFSLRVSEEELKEWGDQIP